MRIMTAPGKKNYRRLLKKVTHGADSTAAPSAAQPEALEIAEVTSRFDYLFGDLAAAFPDHHLPGDPAAVTAALSRLAEAMIEAEPPAGDELNGTGNSIIPPVYTYWGQFIDHDITANTDRNNEVSDITKDVIEPLSPELVRTRLHNLRQPTLNLDSLYGDGPDLDGEPTESGELYDGITLKVGPVADLPPFLPFERIPPLGDDARDLPRRADTSALIGDARNDENLVVAQFHLAFLRFHNAVVQALAAKRNGYPKSEEEMFESARDLVRWHYQWLVVNDYLRTIAMPGIVDKVLLDGNKLFLVEPGDEAYMPLEFSVAAYRFGHSMVRATYDFNRNFGRPGEPGRAATFAQLFAFTGGHREPFGGLGTDTLPFNWVIEWDRFVDKGDGTSDHFARPIDTHIAPPLYDMVNQVGPADDDLSEAVKRGLKMLARRNLLRGYQLALPTGQAVAAKVGARPLSEDELRRGNSEEVNAALADGGFLEHTPLWYYILKEAEVRCHGNFLGEVGSRIIAETLIGQLRADPDSYLGRYRGWSPAEGVRLPNGEPIVTITDLFRFAGVFPVDPT